jgi:RNA polymerase sigma-70 factor (ECF subfamily)
VLPAPADSECANGEQFVRLLVANEQSLFNYCYSLLLNTDDAHEVLQEAAVAMWQRLGEFDFSRPFFPWAARFVFFQVLTLRKRRRDQGRIFTDKTLEMLAEEHAARQPELSARADALATCIAKLPGPARTLLFHRYQRGLTVQEIAQRTNRSVHTLYKVLEKLQNSLLACMQRTLAMEEER